MAIAKKVFASSSFTTPSSLAQFQYNSLAEAAQKDEAIIAELETQDVMQNCSVSKSFSSLSETTERDITNVEEFEVEELVGKCWKDGQSRYFVFWSEYFSEANSWEPVQHRKNA